MDVADVRIPHTDEVFIGGGWRPATGEPHPVVSPSTGRPVGVVRYPSPADATSAVDAADAARETWARTPLADRIAACQRWLDLIDERADAMHVVWGVEAGMPIRHGRTLHRFGTLAAWRSALAGAESVLAEHKRSSELGDVLLRREPVGVVLGILPYNGPVVTIASKVVPALLAGCPVVIKAAPETHLVMAIVAECAREAGFPAGAVNAVCGTADIGRTLTRDPRVDLVSLTGGHAAAQDVLAATHDRYARTQLELGGKSPALILDDAKIDEVLRALVPGATSGAGQVCALLSRVLVSERRHDEVVERLQAAWARLTVGDPLDRATHVGPLINQAALDRVESFVAQAKADGACLVAGGGRPDGLDAGWYHQPTLFTDVGEHFDLASREVFGPVTAVQKYHDLDDAVRLANATEYGLSGAVYTADVDAGIEVASRIRSGSVAVNSFGPDMSSPFGGVRASGWGRESGPEGILGFTEVKQILVGRS
ncbi:aldehyde dehydrogenase family protein [Saccharopolyspora sp. TS4A08]|uniref:Aldehyde dehydrogenase family protein n=1 Tax=Saccharopolyspora ipomoeae TaxID=3042027 RepID=A0ABT6PRG2_9PSEU|nr:aldehyde dehydrogenase family protein [Saccharopolyspora sp. TS4A08]MDI2030604.1 aldehyde dehydrogenase family protein [Saccharopolyspora sp. TS4A08]